MPRKCCVKGCLNSESKKNENHEITFHRFPKSENEKNIWVTQIKTGNNQNKVNEHGVVCSTHFDKSDIIKQNKKTVLRPSSMPQNFPVSSCTEYEVLWTQFLSDEDDKENYDPCPKKRKLSEEPPNASKIVQHNDSRFKMNDGISVKSVLTQTDDGMSVNSVFTQTDQQFQTENAVNQSTGHSLDDSAENITTNRVDAEATEQFSTPKKTRKCRYPGDIDVSVDMTPKTARRNILLCQKKVKSQAQEIYKLKRTTKRLRARIQNLKGLLHELKKKFGLSNHATESIESTFEDDIITQLKEGRKTKSYSENVKCFALTLNFYSNSAYRYIRRVFGNHLPCQSTLYNWYKTVNGEPGVSAEALAILKAMSDEMKKDNKQLLVTLVHDEMAIRKQLIWNDYKKQYVGYVDYGVYKEANDSTEEASDALVFMVVPVNAPGKLPVAYYFTNTFSGEEKAEIIKTLIPLIHNTGAEVIAEKKIKCESCLSAINSVSVVSNILIDIKNRGGLIKPRSDIVKICKIAEQILWSTDVAKPNFFNGLFCRIMRKFTDENLFSNMMHTSQSIDCEHRLTIIKRIVNMYLNIRLRHIANQHNINTKKKYIRAKLTKLIHFSNQ